MDRQPIAIQPGDAAAALHAIGVRITVLAARDQTQGHEVTLQEGPEGAGPPPHSHGWDESFYVLQGSVDCKVDERQIHATSGCFIHVPAGVVHAFSFGTEGGRMLEVAGQGASATALFRCLDREIPPGPPDVPKVLGILREHGVSVAG